MITLALVVNNDNHMTVSPFIEILPTTPAHIRELKKTIRAEDRREYEGLAFSYSGAGPWHSYRHSLFSKTALIDGIVAACWGMGCTLLGDTGIPWLLTSYEAEKISPLRFARIYQAEVYKMLGLCSTLTNWVLADYNKSIRLLQICGFTVGAPEQLPGGIYRKFILERAT